MTRVDRQRRLADEAGEGAAAAPAAAPGGGAPLAPALPPIVTPTVPIMKVRDAARVRVAAGGPRASAGGARSRRHLRARVANGSLASRCRSAALPARAAPQPSGSKFTSVQTISYHESMNPRFRSTMEDACVVVDGFGGDPGTGYFGVYDGHGGRNVAEYLRLNLHNNVEKELRAKGDRSVEECFKAAFIATDVEAAQTGEQASGSTAVVCIVRRQAAKRYVYTANCGDARAVLCHAGAAVRLSRDHKATDAAEKARVEAAGGFVVRKRVMGVLAVARAFGDFVLKKYVTAEPYTSTTKLDVMVRAGRGGESARAGAGSIARGGTTRVGAAPRRPVGGALPPPPPRIL